jgi:hypothetical protein
LAPTDINFRYQACRFSLKNSQVAQSFRKQFSDNSPVELVVLLCEPSPKSRDILHQYEALHENLRYIARLSA